MHSLSGTALAAMEQLAALHLPDGIGYEWTELSYEQKQAGNMAIYVFGASVPFVFMVLAAQYESWSQPLSVILIVPMCLLCGALWPADPRHEHRHSGPDRLRRIGWRSHPRMPS